MLVFFTLRRVTDRRGSPAQRGRGAYFALASSASRAFSNWAGSSAVKVSGCSAPPVGPTRNDGVPLKPAALNSLLCASRVFCALGAFRPCILPPPPTPPAPSPTHP